MKPSVLLIMCPPFWTKLPPLGIAYLATFLKTHDIPCDVLDINITLFNCVPEGIKTQWRRTADLAFQDTLFNYIEKHKPEELERIIAKIGNDDYRAIGFSVFRSNRVFSYALAQKIKKCYPDKTIIFGGPEMMGFADALPATIAEQFPVIDYVIIGEGEEGLLRAVSQKPGKTPQRIVSHEYNSLDAILPPTFNEFSLNEYERKRALPIVFSRGCIKRCVFCSERLLSERYRTRLATQVFKEIEMHYEKNNCLWFTFHDSLINGSLDELRTLCELLIDKNLPIKWDAQVAIRTDMDRELFALMKKAGCFNMFVGLESGSDEVLCLMNKGYTSDDAVQFFTRAHEAALHSEVSLIIGFPGEGEREFKETVDFFKKYRSIIPKVAQVNAFIPRPGTPIVQELDANDNFNYADHYKNAQTNVERLIDFFKEQKIIMTPSFINNLTYEDYET